MTITLAKWSLAEYHQMVTMGILDERKVELLQGKIVEMSPEGEAHAYFSNSAGEYLLRLLGEMATVRFSKPITLTNNSEPEPDLAIVQPLGKEYLNHHPYSENIFWLIECSNSSLAKDLEVKTKIYAQANIPEYWVVNLKVRNLTIFRHPQGIIYTSQKVVTEGNISPLAFPNKSLEVKKIIS